MIRSLARSCVRFSFVFMFIAIGQDRTWANTEEACRVPAAVKKAIKEKYPGYDVISSSLLRQRHRTLFRAEHGKACPGLVKVDFFGDGKRTYAFALAKSSEKKLSVSLVVATSRDQSGSLSLLELDRAELSTAPVIWSEPAGSYKDVRGDRSIQAKYPVVLFVGYEAWAIVYSWTGAEVTKVWVSD